MSQWYVYPREPHDMCIPVHISLVICVSLQYSCQWNVYPLPPPLQTSVGFISVVFVNFANHRQRDYKWFKIMSNTIDKRATIQDKIVDKLSLASLLLCGPQCWCTPLLIQRDYNSYVTSRIKLVWLTKFHSARDNSKSQKMRREYWSRGGHLGIFGWICAARDSKLAPRSKTNFP